jgi:hypothetical protein
MRTEPSAFIAKVAANGRVLWRHVFQASYGASFNGVAVDRAGHASVAGAFAGRLQIGDRVFADHRITGVIARFTPEGALDWVRTRADASMTGIALTSSGNLVATSSSRNRSVVVALSAAGADRWSWDGGSIELDLSAISPAPNGEVVVGGRIHGPARLANRELSPIDPAGDDAIVLRFSSQGSVRWARRFGGPENDRVTHLASDGHGGFIATGMFTGPMRFGDRVLESEGYFAPNPALGSSPPDGFLALFGPGGDPRGAQRFGHDGDDTLWSAKLDAADGLRLLLEHSGEHVLIARSR